MECKDESCGTEKSETCECGSMSSHGHCGCDHGHHGWEHRHGDSSHFMSKMYKHAFFEALHEAQVERIKKRIDAKLGPTLDKTADAVVESFSKIWQLKMQEVEARKELESTLKKIFEATRG